MLYVGWGGTDEWTDYNLTIYDPYSPPGGGNCPQSAIYQMTTENRTGESNFTHQINVCIN